MTWPVDVFDQALIDCEYIAAHSRWDGSLIRKIENQEKLQQQLTSESDKKHGFSPWWIL